MTRLDEMMAALKGWLEATGRPVVIGVPGTLQDEPWLQLEPEWNNDPTSYGLDGLHHMVQHVFVRASGRDFRDAGWLSHQALILLCGTRPPGASMVLGVRCEPCGTPTADREGRMHVEHRLAVAYA